jgi:hypothetical protein
MNAITKRDCHLWQQEIKHDWHEWANKGMSLRDKLIWGRENEVWVGLGYSSWTKCVKGVASKIQVSERHIWRVIKQAPQLQESQNENVSESGKNTPLTEPKTQIPLTSDPELETETLPPIEVYLDKTKRQVPERLVAFFREFDDQVRPIEILLKQLKAAIEDNYDPTQRAWEEFRLQPSLDCIHNIKEYLRKARPWAYCPQCGGDGGIDGNCLQCEGKGWCRWIQWSTVPEELKE